MKIFNYLEKRQISLEISGEFCAEIVRAGLIAVRYQIAFGWGFRNRKSYKGADNSLARPTSRCILFDCENISFDASLVLYI